jgi:HEAT repeat protein
VSDSLVRLGGVAVAPLARFLELPSADPSPALRVARHLGDARLLDAALRHSGAQSAKVRREAAAVLATLGGSQVAQRLTELLDDPDAGVRAAALDGLRRAGHWPAAARIADALTDPAWDVRRNAGLALRAFGAPGVLFLRRSMSHPDAFAADMARHVLQLPAVITSASGHR